MVAETDVRIVDLPLKNAVVNDDTVVSVVNGVASRVKISTIKSTVSQWSDLQNKPFDVLDSTYFVVDTGNALTASQGLANSLHTHSNKIYLDKISEDGSGHITYNGESVTSVADWDDTTNKPFEDLSNDFVVTSGTLSISTDIKHTHANKTVIDKFSEVDGHLLYDGSEISGTTNYTLLTNKPSINNVTLSGNKTFADLGLDLSDYAELNIIASEFDATQAYAVGDVVIYQSDIYKFKVAHTANTAWNSSEVDNVTVVSLIESGGSTPMSIIDTVTAQEIADSINNIWGGA